MALWWPPTGPQVPSQGLASKWFRNISWKEQLPILIFFPLERWSIWRQGPFFADLQIQDFRILVYHGCWNEFKSLKRRVAIWDVHPKFCSFPLLGRRAMGGGYPTEPPPRSPNPTGIPLLFLLLLTAVGVRLSIDIWKRWALKLRLMRTNHLSIFSTHSASQFSNR